MVIVSKPVFERNVSGPIVNFDGPQQHPSSIVRIRCVWYARAAVWQFVIIFILSLL